MRIFCFLILQLQDQRQNKLCFNQLYAPIPKVFSFVFGDIKNNQISGVERSRLTLPITEPERVLIQLRKYSCDVQLSNGICNSYTYSELIDAIQELKSSISSSDNPLLHQMESYRLELEKILC